MNPFRLAWRHLTHYRVRSVLLVLALALTALVPIAVERVLAEVDARLDRRAASTPLVVGAKGSRFDLALNAVWFRGEVPESIPVGTIDEVAKDSQASEAIAVRCGLRAGRAPLVGTTPDYFRFRGLTVRDGELPLELGDCVLGASVAERLEKGVGDRLITESGSLFQLDAGYPLRMKVVGVLSPLDGPDDEAVFASLQTVWIAEGLGHGHDDEKGARIEGDQRPGVTYDSSLRTFQEITDQNRDSFHFHLPPDELPISAVLVVPRDEQASTFLRGRFSPRVKESLQILDPRDVVGEIRDFVFRLKVVFDANVLLVGLATLLLFSLIVLLSLRVRAREFETLRRIGASRGRVRLIVGSEYAILAGAGLLLAIALAFVVERAVVVLIGFV